MLSKIPIECIDRREFKISISGLHIHSQKPCATVLLAGHSQLQDFRLRIGLSAQHGHSPTVPEFTVARIEDRFVACLPEHSHRKLDRRRERLLESDEVRLSSNEPMAKVFQAGIDATYAPSRDPHLFDCTRAAG